MVTATGISGIASSSGWGRRPTTTGEVEAENGDDQREHEPQQLAAQLRSSPRR